MRWTGHVELMGNGSIAYRVLMAKPVEKRPFRTSRRKGEDYI
jgi:hypothetical protein